MMVPKSVLCALVVGLLGSCGTLKLFSPPSLLLKLLRHRRHATLPLAIYMSSKSKQHKTQKETARCSSVYFKSGIIIGSHQQVSSHHDGVLHHNQA